MSVQANRWSRVKAPVITAASIAAGTLTVALLDPHEPGHYPVCPSKWLLGVDCPGCGGLRATHDLAHGDIAGALDHNALFVVMVPLLVLAWVVWLVRCWRGDAPVLTSSTRRRLTVAAVALVIVFAVARNLPFVPLLDSASSA